MPKLIRKLRRKVVRAQQTLRCTAGLLIGTPTSKLPPAYLAMGIRAAMDQLRRGMPGLFVIEHAATASHLSTLAQQYRVTGHYHRAIARLLYSLAADPYPFDRWRHLALLVWEAYPGKEPHLTIEILRFEVTINPSNHRAARDLRDFMDDWEDPDLDDDIKEWLKNP